jgi:uncharacterized alkaline shock family protein YloU
MAESKAYQKVDTKEFELPETLFVRDIENKVFQVIVLESLSRIDGIGLVEGNLIDSLIGRDSIEGVKGIFIEQDNRNHSVGIKVEVNIAYGFPIPEKAEEIQTKISEEITKLTGLHVSAVHVVFKGMISSLVKKPTISSTHVNESIQSIEEQYTDEF